MNFVRVRPAEWLAAAAGALLFVSLFLTWHGGSGWASLAVADVILTVLAATGPALLAAQATRESPAVPAALSVASVIAGLVATIVVIVHLLGSSHGVGAWLALAGALGLLASGWRSTATERVPGVPAPRVEYRPAPRP